MALSFRATRRAAALQLCLPKAKAPTLTAVRDGFLHLHSSARSRASHARFMTVCPLRLRVTVCIEVKTPPPFPPKEELLKLKLFEPPPPLMPPSAKAQNKFPKGPPAPPAQVQRASYGGLKYLPRIRKIGFLFLLDTRKIDKISFCCYPESRSIQSS